MIPRNIEPLTLFQTWLDEAKACAAIEEPTAMTLATVDAQGMPWPRIVLLKGFDKRGFAFFTNLNSQKGRHLAADPRAGLCFHWMPLRKQVRIQGNVERVDDAEADAYFATRSRESQIGAWASKQSESMASRDELEQRYAQFVEKFRDATVPRPPHWSGFRVAPSSIEFWLHQPHRLHDRLRYDFTVTPPSAKTLYP